MIREVLFGVAVGDALGVPVEFSQREKLKANPVTGMIAYGIHNQAAGTFSDDSSMAFCQAEALIGDYTLNKLAELFVAWFYEGYWTPHGEVFDNGIATAAAIRQLKKGGDPTLAGGREELDNGNGSLMRILPLLFYIKDMPMAERYRHTAESSSLTHAHIRSIICCFYYLEYAGSILGGADKLTAYRQTNAEVKPFLESLAIDPGEIAMLNKLWKGKLETLSEDDVSGSGYVLHSLEASIWCLLTTGSYEEAVLKAVNLGLDTDTTGAVTGGLAGLLYGYETIPAKWINVLAKRKDIDDLASRLEAIYG